VKKLTERVLIYIANVCAALEKKIRYKIRKPNGMRGFRDKKADGTRAYTVRQYYKNLYLNFDFLKDHDISYRIVGAVGSSKQDVVRGIRVGVLTMKQAKRVQDSLGRLNKQLIIQKFQFMSKTYNYFINIDFDNPIEI